MLAWIRSGEDSEIVSLANALELEDALFEDEGLDVLLVFYGEEFDESRVRALSDQSGTPGVAFTMLKQTEVGMIDNYKLSSDPRIGNTVFVSNRRKVVAKAINIAPDNDSLAHIREALANLRKR